MLERCRSLENREVSCSSDDDGYEESASAKFFPLLDFFVLGFRAIPQNGAIEQKAKLANSRERLEAEDNARVRNEARSARGYEKRCITRRASSRRSRSEERWQTGVSRTISLFDNDYATRLPRKSPILAADSENPDGLCCRKKSHFEN